MPLVRYRSGDVTRFLAGPSEKSGLRGQRIEKLKGRLNEWTATAMGNIAPWMFEPILNSVKGLSPDWQIAIDKDSHKDLIELHVETLDDAANPSDLKEAVFSNIRKGFVDAWKSYELGLFKMDVKLHPKGELRNGRKLLRLVAKRKF